MASELYISKIKNINGTQEIIDTSANVLKTGTIKAVDGTNAITIADSTGEVSANVLKTSTIKASDGTGAITIADSTGEATVSSALKTSTIKAADGTNAITISGSTGELSLNTELPVSSGGTGASDAATAITNLGAVPTSRTISNGSGISGGGDLSANRTLAVSFSANQDQVKTALNAGGSAPIYACRAWVNFRGSSTVLIYGSGNVSSVTDNGTGQYTINFSIGMQDTNYSIVSNPGNDQDHAFNANASYQYTGSVRLGARNGANAFIDQAKLYVAIFR